LPTRHGRHGRYSSDDIRQSSAYTSARFSLADPLHLIVGARYTEYNIRYNPSGSPSTRLESTKDDVTPYAGLVMTSTKTGPHTPAIPLSSSRRTNVMVGTISIHHR
jgi:outer membrane receptor for ferric coprogen and ferric-rhodotorulic acid